MKCVSALSTARSASTAFHQILERLEDAPDGSPADLTVIFSSRHHASVLGKLSQAFLEQGRTRHVLGCTGEGVVGDDLEVENKPALAVWSLTSPGVEIQPVRFDPGGGSLRQSLDSLEKPSESTLILLADPFSFGVNDLLKLANEHHPGLRIVGGMASGGSEPGANRLLLDGDAFTDGAVAMRLSGPIAIRTVVSQGCRPIGRTMLVTKAEQNVIRELGRRPALESLREVFLTLPPEDVEKVQEGLHIGRVINEYQESFHRGDFLVHNVVGADESGSIQISDLIRVGQTVQFHIRDAETADEDLRESLARVPHGADGSAVPAGALLFTCNGRGSRLFGTPNHDVSVIRDVLGPIPVAGFFAMGELGPIGGQNFIHGYTASVAVFERTDA
ncbi:FIST N-terminal domain-containing protein [Planctomyces sp. SH-PL62]|uniref:FIST signal transduction protein n=1 Tax=Planctomyces sp. SH-PL62 TaxID=1636152 RepID=UPI00078CE4E0|nr:FIST N-terminal domain-containing protein [Planctomyces sp. SH-PL62]AMV36930.1 FIST N domain protein [Planctomyces sp. SH-PL62]